MTDNGLEQAIEKAVNLKPIDFCGVMCKFAEDIINRQKAEIKRLKDISDNKTKELLRYNASIEELHKKLETAKAEAYKEFAERLKAEYDRV